MNNTEREILLSDCVFDKDLLLESLEYFSKKTLDGYYYYSYIEHLINDLINNKPVVIYDRSLKDEKR